MFNGSSSSQRVSQRILEREYNRRLGLNPRFSKRAFAKQLGIAPSFLSHLFNGHRRLTPQVAQKLAASLELSASDREGLLKEALGVATDSAQPSGEGFAEVSPDAFESIANWWTVAVLEYLDTLGSDHSLENLSRLAGLPKAAMESALRSLEAAGLIERDPRRRACYRKREKAIKVGSRIPNDALKRFHGQLMDKAKDAVFFLRPEERVLGSLTIAFDPDDLPMVQERWLAFRDEIQALASQGKRRREVFTAVFSGFKLLGGQ
jgi:transcriptional regulator with XRE-family HTH domain